MLISVQNITNVIASEIPQKIQERIVRQGLAYIPPKDLNGVTLTAHLVIKSLAVSVLIDEYLVSMTSIPEIKAKFWASLKKEGISFHIWSGIDRTICG
jgi:hypothetical protein